MFMGTPDFSVPTLKALAEGGYEIVGVYCQPDKEKGRGKQVQMPPVKMAALELGLPVFQPGTLKDEAVKEELISLQPDIVVVIAYGKILPPWLIRLPKYGCINVHASILPKYRGAAPIHYAILNGDTKTGVTIMHMDDGLDTGDILDIVETNIAPFETTGELFERLADLGAQTINPVLEGWVKGEIRSIPQDDTAATHTAKITKEMGHIDWSKDGEDIANLIRGLNPAPGCYTYLNGTRLKIWFGNVIIAHNNIIEIDGDVVSVSGSEDPGTIIATVGGLLIATGNNSYLLITEVQPENKKRMTAQDFINGHQIKGGMAFDKG